VSNLKNLKKKVGYVGPTVSNVPREFGKGEHFVKLAYITPDEAKLLKKVDMYDSNPPHTGPEIKGIPNYNDFGGGGDYGGYRSGEAMGAAERGNFGSRDFQASGMSRQQGQAIRAGADLAGAIGNFNRDQSNQNTEAMYAAQERYDALNTDESLSESELGQIESEYNENLLDVQGGSSLAQVYQQNPNIFTGNFSDYYQVGNTIYNKIDGTKIGTVNTVGAMYGLPGIGKYLGMAGSFFGVDPDMPTFTVDPFFAKTSGLEREMGGGNGGDNRPSTMEILYPTEETLTGEETGANESVLSGYDLNYYNEIQPYTTFARGGLAALPANFNPMTNANPFSIMMRRGR
jgi:hypothetical protein